ncbi:14535_t:CDS:2 [Acaulospora morrowiae]|uniref:14535_t:CDS:1 n=1 Tax=Acaulospora morrowiae TaxID=94023 RepID=A0A9N9H090_9GLOM|nr:14535_t:CDS:2 [Acaulospora morrowiae]
MAKSKALLLKAIHGLIILGVIIVFSFDLYKNIKGLNIITQSLEVVKKASLVPPAVTLCLARDVTYTFKIAIYGNVVTQGEYLVSYPSTAPELANLAGVVTKCWILAAPNKQAVITDPPPVPNIPDMVLNYTRFFDGTNITSPLFINIFDPLQEDTNFKFSRFVRLDPDVNRAISFSRTEHYGLDQKITSNVATTMVDEFRDSSQTTASNATSTFTIRPESFNVFRTTEVQSTTWWTIIIHSVTFIGILFGSVYVPLVGRGKYRPWGFLHMALGYYPIEHISPSDEEKQHMSTNEMDPSLFERLKVYLEKIDIAKYENHP